MKRPLVLGLALLLASGRADAQDEEPPPAAPAPEAGEPTPGELPIEPVPASAEPELPALQESELALLGLDATHEAVDKSFHFWGFADFVSFLPLRSNASSVALGRRQSFYVGNVNLYLSRNLSETFRTMGEVRLTYLPNGGLKANSASLEVLDTQVLDYADNSRVNRWGGIIMQRLYLEWTLHRFVTVRGGQFLTPFGIWNVDHGSPAYIPVQRPYIVNSNSGYFPERQTGLELLGRWDIHNAVGLGYHLTLSNGGGSVAEYRDFDKNKALGARLYLEHIGESYFRLGASGYYGRSTDASPAPKLSPAKVEIVNRVLSQYDALSLAGDVLLKAHHLYLQAEVASQQRRYTNDGRVATAVYFAPQSVGFPQNFISWGGYVLAAYELPWYALTPYMMGQHSKEILFNGFTGYLLDMWQLQAGLNVHPIDEVVFKLEYDHGWFPRGGPVLANSIRTLQLQAAWAF